MNRQAILDQVNQKYFKTTRPEFRVGDTVRIAVKITEGDTTRIQAFEGTVISMKGTGVAETFTVRKISFGVGVERVFPYNSPNVEKIDIVRSGHSRRAKLYYLRDRIGRAAKLEDKDAGSSEKKAETKPTKPSSEPELVAAEKK
jgi:large subunit ribosomal protein L19